MFNARKKYSVSKLNRQDRSSLGSKASVDALRLHLHSIIPPRPFFRMFTRPFRRKSVPSSPALPPKTYRSSSEGPADTVTLARALRAKRVRALKKRLKRADVYVKCRAKGQIGSKRRKRVCSCSNSVVSDINARCMSFPTNETPFLF